MGRKLLDRKMIIHLERARIALEQVMVESKAAYEVIKAVEIALERELSKEDPNETGEGTSNGV